ncbi:hypothetical protein PMAYCL1PPCAC_26198, partial [Pristionchus mayeri]
IIEQSSLLEKRDSGNSTDSGNNERSIKINESAPTCPGCAACHALTFKDEHLVIASIRDAMNRRVLIEIGVFQPDNEPERECFPVFMQKRREVQEEAMEKFKDRNYYSEVTETEYFLVFGEAKPVEDHKDILRKQIAKWLAYTDKVPILPPFDLPIRSGNRITMF